MQYGPSDSLHDIMTALQLDPLEDRDNPRAQTARALAAIDGLKMAAAPHRTPPKARRKNRPKVRPKTMTQAELAHASYRIRAAAWNLHAARTELAKAGAHKAADYVRRAIKSTDGAFRHNRGLFARTENRKT